ncbi:MAG: hypothetical protein KF697_02070 [Pseudolabrys sp.]|nr:hypothetical protein [Pseudolabrys sp.]
MLSASRYVLAGHPRNCAFCREPLTTQAHRRDNAYFCNELCADAAAEVADTPRVPGRDLKPSRPRAAPALRLLDAVA